MFPLEVSGVINYALVAKICDANLWHLWYGHLNVRGMKLLCEKNMVIGLPKLEVLSSVKGAHTVNRPGTHFQ